MRTSRDYPTLLLFWTKWFDLLSSKMAPLYPRFVQLANQGARDFGFADTGALWLSGYDMPESQVREQIVCIHRQRQAVTQTKTGCGTDKDRL